MLGRWLFAASFLLAACAAPTQVGSVDLTTPDPIQITARPVPLNQQDAAQSRVGRLVYRGGVNLTANDSRFGGWSDLDISENGARLTAISDRGFWFDADVDYDEQGNLKQLSGGRLGLLRNLAGRPQPGLAGDAEGLARAPDGSFYVSYERRHRIWLYPAAEPPFSQLAGIVPMPQETAEIPENGGIEAIARLPGGRLFALTEEFYTDSGLNIGWVGDGRSWSRVTYQAGPEFKPTSATALPNGDVFVLERRFTKLGVPGARVVRLAADDIRPGAQLHGTELALVELPLTLDNFEGIAARLGPGGEVFLYLISDDNYFFLQRTLLLMFELRDERPRVAVER